MTLEWLRRRDPGLNARLEEWLFTTRALSTHESEGEPASPAGKTCEGKESAMDDLHRALAPITGEGWKAIEDELRRALSTHQAGRRLVQVEGPAGWTLAAVGTGRVEPLNGKEMLADQVEARVRVVQPMVELRHAFELSRDELDAIARGSLDPELEPVRSAARSLALAEDRLLFLGHPRAGIRGIAADSVHRPIVVQDPSGWPGAIARAIDVLRDAGVAGPYALALGREAHTQLATTIEGGFPVLLHVQRLLDGPLVWSPALEQGGLVASLRGGDGELVLGRDVSVGYERHDGGTVRLYLEESLTFRLLSAEAAVAIRTSSPG